MKILQRYVVHELWMPFLLSFVTLNFIFLGGYLVKVANLIIGHGIPLSDTMLGLILALPGMVVWTAPTGLLTAVMIVFGNLSQNNEIRAMRASGVNPILVIFPALVVGLALSVLVFVFNDQIATYANFQLRKTTKKMLIKHPMAMIEPGRFVNLSDNVIFHAKKVVGSELREIVAYENEGQDQPVRTIIAERGAIVSTNDNTEIQIRLYDGSISDADGKSVQSIQFKTYEFPTLGQEDIRNLKKKVRDNTLAELLVQAQDPHIPKDELLRVWSAFHERIAFSLGSFIFVFIGVPIAILVRRGEIVLSFGIAMSCVCLYYVLFAGARTLSEEAVLPTYLAYWLPNFFLLGAGGVLLKKSFNN